MEQAVKEGLIPFNLAQRADKPKMQEHEVNYFQPEQIQAIREALENEPLKWRVLVHLLLITGARRGEILGLKWDKVDFENKQLIFATAFCILQISAYMKVRPKPKNQSGIFPFLPKQ